MPSESNSVPRTISSAGFLLALCALAGMGLMTSTYLHSKEYIQANEREVLLRTVTSVLTPGTFNNDVINDIIAVTDYEWLGSKNALTIYRARMNGEPTGAVLSVIAPDGYSGPIRLTVGINSNDEIIGVRVISHRETPGLGDGIEVRKSSWIKSFNGLGLSSVTDSQWKVKKDGGRFDQFTGATITPRAVVKAVHRCLQYYVAHKKLIYSINNSVQTS